VISYFYFTLGFGFPAFLLGPAFLKVPFGSGARLAGAFFANFFGPDTFLNGGRLPSNFSDLSGLSDLSERSTLSVSARQVDVAGRESDL
jgi:hypothetical protein